MSSMFKKKGGLAFKPKAPVARARPSAPTSKPISTPAPTPQPAIEAPPAALPEEEPETVENESTAGSSRPRDTQATVEEEPEEPQKASPVASRRSTRRASPSQHSDTASVPSLSQTEEATTQSDKTAEPSPAAETAIPAPPPEAAPRTQTRRQSAAKPSAQPSTETTETAAPSTEDAVASQTPDLSEQSQSAPAATPSEEPAVATAPKPAPKRATRKPSAKAAENAAPDDDNAQVGSSRPKKRQKRAPRAETGEIQTPAPRKRKTPAPKANGRSRSSSRRARSPTPEDAETQVVDLQKLKMSDLTKDLRIGKKFSRHDELLERERKARLKAKLEKDGDNTSEADDPNNNNNETSQSPAPNGTRPKTTSSTPTNSSGTPAPAATSGPQFRIVDGQIVVDQDSLVMDRHARAAAAQAGEDMETIEENDFTRLITSSSFMNTSKLKGPNIWTEPETELFYRGLRMFGTEFEMISKMFPGKQRRHVKLKFNREERHNPQRIDAALIGEKTIKMDIDEYRAFTGTEFEPVETIEAEQRKIEEEYEAERQRIADEQAEIMRKKREELFADEEGDGKKKKKKGKKGKQAVQYGLNGEPIVAEE